jgi:hypothetical protein
MGRKQELTYPVTPEWKERVKELLEERGRGAQAALAKAIRCSSGTLAELLGPDARHSHLVPRIHDYFGWPAPMAPLASPDAAEISFLYDRLSEVDRARLLERARTMLELKKKS